MIGRSDPANRKRAFRRRGPARLFFSYERGTGDDRRRTDPDARVCEGNRRTGWLAFLFLDNSNGIADRLERYPQTYPQFGGRDLGLRVVQRRCANQGLPAELDRSEVATLGRRGDGGAADAEQIDGFGDAVGRLQPTVPADRHRARRRHHRRSGPSSRRSAGATRTPDQIEASSLAVGWRMRPRIAWIRRSAAISGPISSVGSTSAGASGGS